MTREEILNMSAGKKLDWEIAKLMGVSDKMFRFAHDMGNFNYSTDISAAWEAWDLGREDEHLILECKDGEYCATIHRLKRGQEIFDVDTWTYSAKTKEEAMIKCRLLSVLDSINLPREEEIC